MLAHLKRGSYALSFENHRSDISPYALGQWWRFIRRNLKIPLWNKMFCKIVQNVLHFKLLIRICDWSFYQINVPLHQSSISGWIQWTPTWRSWTQCNGVSGQDPLTSDLPLLLMDTWNTFNYTLCSKETVKWQSRSDSVHVSWCSLHLKKKGKTLPSRWFETFPDVPVALKAV